MPTRNTTTDIPDAEQIAAEYERRSSRLGQMRDELRVLRAATPTAEHAPTVVATGEHALRQQIKLLASTVEKLVEREQSSLGQVLERLQQQQQPTTPVDPHLRDMQRLELSRIKNQIAPIRWPLLIAIVLFGVTMLLANLVLMGLMTADILTRTS
jgi:hypothetical protein